MKGAMFVDEKGSALQVPHEESDEVFNQRLFKKIYKMSEETKQNIATVADQWKSIQEVMDYATDHIKKSWVDFASDAPKLIQDIRNARMAIATEYKQVSQIVKDVDDCLNGPAAVARRESLSQLVDLCERVEKLRQSGTFDAVLDALIKRA